MEIFNEKEGRFNIGTSILAFVAMMTVVLVIWVAFASAIWGFGVATAGIYGRGEAHKQIQSAAFRLEAYQSFFDQCASIQGLEGRIDELQNQLDGLEKNSRAYNLTLSSLTGTKGMRHDAIAKYNQDSLKNYTEAQFKDRDLPYQLVDNDYPPTEVNGVKRGGKTTCAVS